MTEQQDRAAAAPSAWQKRLVSLLIAAHLFAILTAVTSFSSPGFPAPLLAVLANRPVTPYLQATFLNNAYRFFAPNPGAPTVLWFRIQHADRSVKWLEAPAAGSWLRPIYQRNLNVAMTLGQQLVPDGDKRCLTPVGQVGLSSYVRHVAGTATQPVKTIGVYFAQHSVLLPEQIRTGWDIHDLPTYQAFFVGAFTPDGVRVDERRPEIVEQPITRVAAGILAVDFYPVLKQRPGSDAVKLAEEIGLPVPIRRLLSSYAELSAPPAGGARLQDRLEELLQTPGQAAARSPAH